METPGEPAVQKPRTYYAFISYSHRDSAVVRRLHKELEQYRVPVRLAGKPSPVVDVIPRRLQPIFLDREELPSSPSLNTPIQDALDNARTLIVVCSPHAATSRWVNGEVEYFKRHGRSNRIICVILDGEPNATDKPDLGAPECFCPALRFAMDADGSISDRREEPLAADVRREGDGWKRAKLKLIAGMLGVPFDELNQRERERKKVKTAWQLATAVIALGAGVIGAITVNDHYRHVEGNGYAKRAKVELEQRHHLAAALYAEASANVFPDTAALQEVVQELKKAFPEPVAVFTTQVQRLEHVLLSPDGRTVYAAGGDGKLHRWSLDGLQAAASSYVIVTNKRALARLALPRSGAPLLISTWDANVILWDPATESITHRIGAHFRRTRVFGLATDGTQPRFATAGEDGFVKLWPLNGLPVWNAGTPPLENLAVRELVEHDASVKAVAISPDGTRVASGGFDSTLRLSAMNGGPTVTFTVGDDLNTVAFSPDGKLVLAAGRDGHVHAYDGTGASPKRIWLLDKAHSGRINDLALVPDGSAFVTAADDGAIRVWSLTNSPQLLLTIESENAVPTIGAKKEVKILGVAVSNNGTLIAGSQNDGKVSVWKNAPAVATTFADLRPMLARRVPVQWQRGELKERGR